MWNPFKIILFYLLPLEKKLKIKNLKTYFVIFFITCMRKIKEVSFKFNDLLKILFLAWMSLLLFLIITDIFNLTLGVTSFNSVSKTLINFWMFKLSRGSWEINPHWNSIVIYNLIIWQRIEKKLRTVNFVRNLVICGEDHEIPARPNPLLFF